ncbi:MAG: glycosyltransferase family 4 protein [bacterium]
MKVAMLGWEFPPFISGGLGIHCLEITQDLARQGVSIDFYMPHMTTLEGSLRVADHHEHLRIKEIEADAAISPYGGGKAQYDRGFNDAVALYNQRLVAAFDSHDADVLHAHDWITIPAALAIKERTGKPLVVTMHSMESDRSAGFHPQQWIADIERRGVREADLVIAVSRYTKQALVQQYGIDPGKVVAIHNGIDASKFRSADHRDYATAPGPVLFLSRLSRQKGPLSFLRAARRVLEIRPDTRFVMAGTGEMLGECIEYALEHGMGNRVQFTGFVGNADLADVYAHHGLYVLPSVSEPFGISVLEAMATGLPTIVSHSCGVGEALHHVLRSDHDDVDEMARMIIALVDNAALREEMGRNGAKEAVGFTWALCAARTKDLYTRLAPLAPAPLGAVAAHLALHAPGPAAILEVAA